MPVSNGTVAPTVDEFNADYPEFAKTDSGGNDVFPGSAKAYWLQVAVNLLNAGRWGNMYYVAVELFMAHNLALEAWSAQGGPNTIPGIAKGPIAGKGAGGVSVAYNTVATLDPTAGHWNYTTYGQRLVGLINMFGAGPIQVGPGGCGGGGGWAGPPFFNFPNPSG